MKLGLTVDEVLGTTRAVRKRLDFDRPVEPEIIKECLELALGAERFELPGLAVAGGHRRRQASRPG